jgi:hypothetical protein
MSTKKNVIKEGLKAGLKKLGKKAAAGAVGVAGAMLNTQKAYGGQLTKKQLQKKYKFLPDDGKGGPLPKKKTKMSMRKPKASICPSGIAWAKRTFDKYPSAYANMAASKYCKDPNYAKGSKKKKK